MPEQNVTINHALALGQQFTGGKPARSRNEGALYPLSLGAGDPPTDPGELAYLDGAPRKILPTFAWFPPSASPTFSIRCPGLATIPPTYAQGL